MPTPHKNFRPPAGSVIDVNDARLSWDGSNWKLNGKKHTVPSSHHLIGKPGGPLTGWTYDWKQKAWIQPDVVTTRPSPTSRPSLPSRPPVAPRPAAPIVPVAPQPVTQTKETSMTYVKPETAFQALLQHPIAPLVGGGLIAIAKFTEGPVPPPISEQLTDAERTDTMMRFQQNQLRFTQRMDLYATIGMALLGHAEAQAVFTAFAPPTAQVATAPTFALPMQR